MEAKIALKEALSSAVIQRLGFNTRVKFKGDNITYYVKNVSPDQKSVFVTRDSGIGTWRKPLSRLVQINGKPLMENIGKRKNNYKINLNEEDQVETKDPKSSTVKSLRYFPKTNTLQVMFHSGAVYEYYNVNSNDWNNIRDGRAAATTSGENAQGRWWKGKKPSVGAAIHVYLIGKGVDYKRI